MTQDEWKKVEELFLAAEERSPEGRAGFLDEACAGQPQQRLEVEAMLQAGNATDAVRGIVSQAALAEAEAPQRVGPYRVIRKLGEGGMGSVYLSSRDDDLYQKQVAIKVIRAGLLDSAMVSRFELERQILAGLTHPNVAQLFDAGTTTIGQPYVVMEYVEGTPIDQYCRDKSIVERLRLFEQVCEAVGYAHQKLIVHRDIKPANILVTPAGVVKLLDFGIAKLLDEGRLDASALTGTGDRVLTPAYASPEQILGKPVTPASDIFSLGVLLYELLAGVRPFEGGGDFATERAICEIDPKPPSATVPALKGDLDDIVMMALRKEPAERYRAVNEFSADVERHLQSFPVKASAGSRVYRARKFARRNRFALAWAALLAVMAGGWVVSLRMEQARTREHFNQVREISNKLLFTFDRAIQDLPGSTPARKLAVSEGLKYLRTLAHGSRGDLSLEQEVAAGYLSIADIQYRKGDAHIGDLEGSLASLKEAARLYDEYLGKRPDDWNAQQKLALCYRRLSDNLRFVKGSAEQADQYMAKNAAIIGDLYRLHPSDESIAHDAGVVAMFDAEQALRKGDGKTALTQYRKGFAIYQTLFAAHPNDARLGNDVAVGHLQIGEVLGGGNTPYNLGDYAGAIKEYGAAMDLLERLLKSDPDSRRLNQSLAAAHNSRAATFRLMKQSAKALADSRQAVSVMERLAERDPANHELARNVTVMYGTLAAQLYTAGEAPAATALLLKGLKIREDWLAGHGGDLQAITDVATAEANLADALLDIREFARAEPFARRGLAHWQQLSQLAPTVARYRVSAAFTAHRWGVALRGAGRMADAHNAFLQASQWMEGQQEDASTRGLKQRISNDLK